MYVQYGQKKPLLVNIRIKRETQLEKAQTEACGCKNAFELTGLSYLEHCPDVPKLWVQSRVTLHTGIN